MTAQRRDNVYHIQHPEKASGYRFEDRDPDLAWVCEDILDTGWPHNYVAERAGVSASTINNWMAGRTKHPQNATVKAVIKALGWNQPTAEKMMQHAQMRRHRRQQ